MAGRLILDGWQPALDANANPISGARATVYTEGTTTPATVYSDAALTTPLTNPVVSNSAGQFAGIFADSGLLYDVKIATSAGAQLAYLLGVRAIGAPGEVSEADLLAALDDTLPPLISSKANTIGDNTAAGFAGNVPFKQVALAEARNLADKVAKGIGPDIFDFIPPNLRAGVLDGTNTTNLSPYFQAAHDLTPEGQTIRCDVGQFRLATTVNLTKAHFWYFGKPVLSPFIGTQGVIVRPTADGTSLFRLTRGASPVEVRGTAFIGMTVFETAHPAAATDPWTPANYGYVIDSYYTLGETQVIDCYAPGVNKFLRSVGAGRTNLIDFKGFVFTTLKYADVAKDRDRTISVHHWPYLYQSIPVYTWMAANTKLFVHGRVDTPYYDDIFCFGGNTLFQMDQVYYGAYAGPYADTAAYIAAETPANPFPAVYATGTNGGVQEPGSRHAFSTTNMVVGEAYAESFKDALTIDCIEFTMQAAVFQHIGDFFGNNVPITGGATIRANQSGAKVLIGVFRPHRLNGSAVVGAGAAVEITAAASFFDDCNRGGGQPLINLTGAASVFALGSRPIQRNVNGAVLGVCVTPFQQNNVAAQTGRWFGTGAAAGGAPLLTVTSSEANCDGSISSKGTGILYFAGGSATTQLRNGGQNVNGTSVLLGRSRAFDSALNNASVANGASASFTIGISGTDATWDVTAIRHLGINAIGWTVSVPYYAGSGTWVVCFTNNTGSTSTALASGGIRATAEKWTDVA